MTTNLVTVSPETYVSKVMQLFEKYSFHHLPVVKNANELVGIISKEDMQKVANLIAMSELGMDADRTTSKILTAKDIMTQYPLSLDPDDSIGLAADIILGNRFHAIPVIEDGMLIGLVTSHDLIAHAFNSPVGSELE